MLISKDQHDVNLSAFQAYMFWIQSISKFQAASFLFCSAFIFQLCTFVAKNYLRIFLLQNLNLLTFLSSGKFSTQKSALRKVLNFSASASLTHLTIERLIGRFSHHLDMERFIGRSAFYSVKSLLHLTGFMKHKTCDTQGVVNIVSKFHVPSSNVVEVMMFQRLGGKG